MAKVTFVEGQPLQSLSGTVGNITFRTINGRTFARELTAPTLPKNPTRQQRDRFKRQTLINDCIAILQSQYEDIQEAIAVRPKIKDRLNYLYKSFAPTIKTRTKLQKKIMTEYYARFSVTSPCQSRGNADPFSNQSRNKSQNS